MPVHQRTDKLNDPLLGIRRRNSGRFGMVKSKPQRNRQPLCFRSCWADVFLGSSLEIEIAIGQSLVESFIGPPHGQSVFIRVEQDFSKPLCCVAGSRQAFERCPIDWRDHAGFSSDWRGWFVRLDRQTMKSQNERKHGAAELHALIFGNSGRRHKPGLAAFTKTTLPRLTFRARFGLLPTNSGRAGQNQVHCRG